MEEHVGGIDTIHLQSLKKLLESVYSTYGNTRPEEIEKEKSSEIREVENRVENDETINIVVGNREPIVETLQPEKTSTDKITTEETTGEKPGITTEENVGDTPGITTEETVGYIPDITTEETVGDTPGVTTEETVGETPGIT